jgi:hypothetical protein
VKQLQDERRRLSIGKDCNTGLTNWRCVLDRVNPAFSAALLGFNGEAVIYCQGISDVVAQEYAMQYARMLQNRAKGVETQLPRFPAGLFEPNRNLIRSTLERMWEKHFTES